MNNTIENEKGLGLGITIIIILIALLILPFFYGIKLGPFRKGPSAIFIGVFLQFSGILSLLSYYYTHKTFFFRGLMWLCENLSGPKGRKMAFFYFALEFGLGTFSLIKGLGFFSSDIDNQDTLYLPPGTEPIEDWWYKEPMLYIVLLLIIGIGFYRSKIRKDK